MKISIAMATYNGERFLSDQLESFAAQVRLPDEVVVSDDASRDATLDLLDAFAARAPFEVRVLRQDTNVGYAGNFDRALRACTGDLVLPCDQDDLWFTQKLSKMEGWVRKKPEAAIFACDAELTDAALVPSGRSKRGQIAALGLPEEAFVMGCCLAIRREFLDIALPIPAGANAHDSWLVELADQFGLVERRAEILQYYRQHESNVSDFAANTTQAIGPLRRAELWTKGLSRRLRGSGGLSKELARQQLQAARASERKLDLVRLAGTECTELGIATLSRNIERLEARAAVRAASVAGRPFALASNWSKAGYGGRAGLAGALRDLTARIPTQ